MQQAKPSSRALLCLLLAAGLGGCAGSGAGASRPTGSHTFQAAGSTINVVLDPALRQDPAEVMAWVHIAAEAVTTFYGHYPVPSVEIDISPETGEPVNSGAEYDGRRISIHLDPGAIPADLYSDWELTHEMFHLGFPSQDERYHYLEEGLSDYLEPLARARIGNLAETEVWKGYFEGMPQGLPGQAGSAAGGGLDGTRDWGRVYWGGCIFWFLVDLDIRERSNGRKSLDDAIRAMVDGGGDARRHWPLERVIDVGDGATGTGSIRRIHDLLGPKAADPHLNDVWKKLGVREEGHTIVLDDTAPLASIRRAMTARVTPVK